MKNTLIIVFLGLLLVGLVTAATDEDIDKINYLGEVGQYECKLILQSCATCTYANVSIFRGNETLVDNMAMSNSGASWSYSYCNDGTQGRYDVVGFGDLDGSPTSFDAMYFKVTPSGFYLSLGFYFLVLILSIGVVWFGFHIEDNWVIVLGGFGLILFGLLILFYGLDSFKDTTYTWGLGIITIMLGAYFSVRGSYEALVN